MQKFERLATGFAAWLAEQMIKKAWMASAAKSLSIRVFALIQHLAGMVVLLAVCLPTVWRVGKARAIGRGVCRHCGWAYGVLDYDWEAFQARNPSCLQCDALDWIGEMDWRPTPGEMMAACETACERNGGRRGHAETR